MPLTAYPGLLAGLGAPYLNVAPQLTTGRIFFVDSNYGKANNDGQDPLRPMTTLAAAYAKCRASRGDMVVMLPGHAETTSGISLATAGVKIAGVGFGRNRPTITSDGATADVVNAAAANLWLENFRIAGAAAACTALLDMSSAATDLTAAGMEFAQAATPLSGITIGAAHRFLFDHCTWIGTANGPDRCVSFEAKCNDWQILSPRFLFGTSGLDNELIKAVNVCTGYLIDDVLAVGLDALLVNFASSSAGAPDGFFASGKVMASAALTSIEDLVAAATSLGMAFGQVFANDATGKRGGNIPLTSAS